jgi:GNAT superfamily N-acetyltransferase
MVEGVPYAWLYTSYKQFMHRYLMVHAFKLEKLEDKKELLCLFAVEKEVLVGFKLGYTHPDGVFYSWLGGVDEKMRGQGIASQLMKYQHEKVQMLGFNKVRTYGRNERKAMLTTNIKHGFDIISTFVDDKGRHKIVFEKLLN